MPETSATEKPSNRTLDRQPSSFLRVGPHRIAYRKYGNGPHIVFVHGWPLHGGTWRNIVPHLQSSHTCYVIDLPGTGDTRSAEGTRLALQDNDTVLEGVIDQLGLDRYALVGHDSGGMFVRQIAARRSEQVAALVIAGTEIPHHVPWQIRVLKGVSRIAPTERVLPVVLGNRQLRRSPLALGGCFANMKAAGGDFAKEMLAPMRDPRVAQGQAQLLKTFDPSHADMLAEVHPLITSPTMMIWGEKDPFFPIEKARKMAANFGTRVRFESIPDAKLFVHEEHPTRFAELTADFLAPITASA